MGIPSDKIKLALLLTIRDLQPITYQEFLKLLETRDARLPKDARQILYTHWPAYRGETYVNDLLAAGLIEREPDVYWMSAKLRTTSALAVVQDLFAISLKALLTHADDGIEMHPTFGQPLANDRDGAWAQVFVAMPFLDRLRPVYNNHIKTVTDALGLTCKRGDDFFTTNRIMDDVWSAIYHADLCIVDCTGRNPNVFYELGIAHTLGRKAVLIAQTIDDIPFDVRDRRVITYEYTPSGMVEFEEKLKKTLQAELG